MLKKYSELTEQQKKQVSVMYSEPGILEMYLYNYDDNGNYHGRQYNPPEGETKDGLHFGRLHIELEDKKEEDKPSEYKPSKAELEGISNANVVKPKEEKKPVRKTKKK